MQRPPDELLDQYPEGSVEVPAPEVSEDFAVFLRPLSLAEFREFINGGVHDETRFNAQTQAIMRAALWPSRSEINAGVSAFGGLVGRLSNALEELGGKPTRGEPAEQDRWNRFDATVGEDELAELGISPEVAKDLLARYSHPGQLRSCVLPALGIVFVVKRPTLACFTKLGERISKEGEFFDATVDASVDCVVYASQGAVVHPADRVVELLRQFPAIPTLVLFKELTKMARGEASTTAKKSVRRGKLLGASR